MIRVCWTLNINFGMYGHWSVPDPESRWCKMSVPGLLVRIIES